MLNEMLDVSMEEQILLNSEDDEDINIFATLAVMMRRDLHRNEGFCEITVPSYSIDEFQSHFRMTRSTMEALWREVGRTGRVPERHAFGREPIPLQKQVLAFVWFISNKEAIRSVSDRFNVTLSSLDRILRRVICERIISSGPTVRFILVI